MFDGEYSFSLVGGGTCRAIALLSTVDDVCTCPQLPSSRALSTSTMDDGVDEGAANANDDVSPTEEALFVMTWSRHVTVWLRRHQRQ